MGKIKDVINNVDIKVLTSAPGASITDKQNMPITARSKYCPSQNDHRCDRRERSVSVGFQDVCSVARDDPGDWPLLNRDPNFLRIRLKPGMDGHPIKFCLVNVVGWVSSIAGNIFDLGDFIVGPVSLGGVWICVSRSRRRTALSKVDWRGRCLTYRRFGGRGRERPETERGRMRRAANANPLWKGWTRG